MLLLDGAKSLYAEVLALVESRLRPGALVIVNNANYCPEYPQHIRLPLGSYMSMPFERTSSFPCGWPEPARLFSALPGKPINAGSSDADA